MEERIQLMVNGTQCEAVVEGEPSLLTVLRDTFNLTGAKIGCGEGQCGTCTVLLDTQPVRACITPIEAAAGKVIQTIEGLAQEGRLHPLQQAFLDQEALQCGYCTAGMIMNALGLLLENDRPTRDEIITAMQGNICRCGTYPRIIRAIEQAAVTLRARMEGGRHA